MKLSEKIKSLRKGAGLSQEEFGGKAEEVVLSDIAGNTELDINSDVLIKADSFSGKVSLNQIGAVSAMYIPAGKTVSTKARGVRTRIICASQELISPESKDLIELNGIESELTLIFE